MFAGELMSLQFFPMIFVVIVAVAGDLDGGSAGERSCSVLHAAPELHFQFVAGFQWAVEIKLLQGPEELVARELQQQHFGSGFGTTVSIRAMLAISVLVSGEGDVNVSRDEMRSDGDGSRIDLVDVHQRAFKIAQVAEPETNKVVRALRPVLDGGTDGYDRKGGRATKLQKGRTRVILPSGEMKPLGSSGTVFQRV